MYDPQFYDFPINTDHVKYSLVYDNSYHTPYDPGLDPSHVHSEYEFYVNISGDVCFLVNNKFYPISKGDVIVAKPNDVHICVYNSPCTHEHFCLWLDCEDKSPLLDFTRKNFSNRYSFSEKNKNKILELFYKLKDSKNDLEKSALILTFLSLFSVEKYIDTVNQETTLPSEMQKILDYINSYFINIHSVKEISDNCYISTATLNRWFSKYLQISPREFLEAKKLAYAKKLLQMGMGVNNVCAKAGFSDCSYFIAVFKKKFGDTPLKYYKKNV